MGISVTNIELGSGSSSASIDCDLSGGIPAGAELYVVASYSCIASSGYSASPSISFDRTGDSFDNVVWDWQTFTFSGEGTYNGACGARIRKIASPSEVDQFVLLTVSNVSDPSPTLTVSGCAFLVSGHETTAADSGSAEGVSAYGTDSDPLELSISKAGGIMLGGRVCYFPGPPIFLNPGYYNPELKSPPIVTSAGDDSTDTLSIPGVSTNPFFIAYGGGPGTLGVKLDMTSDAGAYDIVGVSLDPKPAKYPPLHIFG